jgi:superfamily II DNA/RNA helicase
MRGEVIGLARTHMRHPVNIRAESASDAEMVPLTAQFVYQVHDLDKTEIIARVLQAENSGLSLVFTRTKRAAQRVAEDLMDRGFPAAPLHGDMAQVARERALKRFRDGTVEILVATDVAARGIDVAGITHVINYSCPEDEKTYIHRTGRTGRAGATGSAITFVDWADLTRWKVINKMLALPFDEPNEVYSTSEQLYHDHGIPPGTKGRIGSPAPRDDAGKVDDARAGGRGGGRARSGSSSSSGAGKGRESGSERSRSRNRQRTRTRGGANVSSTAQDQVSGGSSQTAEADATPDGGGTGTGSESTSSRRRRRSGGRNRTRSSTSD